MFSGDFVLLKFIMSWDWSIVMSITSVNGSLVEWKIRFPIVLLDGMYSYLEMDLLWIKGNINWNRVQAIIYGYELILVID